MKLKIELKSLRVYKSNSKKILFIIPFLLIFLHQSNSQIVYSKNGKVGLVNKNKDTLTKAIYHNIYNTISENFLIVRNNNYYGLIDTSGKTILPVQFDSLKITLKYARYYFRTNLNRCEALLDDNLKVTETILPVKLGNKIIHSYLDPIKSRLTFENKDGKIGLMDILGVKLTKAQFDAIIPTETPGMYQVEVDNKIGIINSTGKIVIPIQFSNEISCNNGFSFIRNGDSYSLWDKNGKQLTESIFFYPYDFDEPYFSARILDDKYVLLDSSGRIISDKPYDQIYPMSDLNCFRIIEDNFEGILFIDGTKIDPIYEDIYYYKDFGSGMFKIKKNGLYGLLSLDGKTILTNKYEDINSSYFNENVLITKKEGKYGIVSVTGKVILENVAPKPIYINDQFTPVYNGVKYGALIQGRFLFDFQFDTLPQILTDNRFIVKKEKYFGVIDSLGKTIIPFKFSKIEYYNYYTVYNENKIGLFDDKGIEIMKTEYDHFYINNSFIEYTKGIIDGIADMNGNSLVEGKYRLIYPLHNNHILVLKGKKSGLFNVKEKRFLLDNLDSIDTYEFNNQNGFIYKLKNKFGFIPYPSLKIEPAINDSLIGVSFGILCLKNSSWEVIHKDYNRSAAFGKMNKILSINKNFILCQRGTNFYIYDGLLDILYDNNCKTKECAFDSLVIRKNIEPILQQKIKIYQVAINEDKSLMVTDNYKNITLWDLSTGHQIDHYSHHPDPHFSSTGFNDLKSLGFIGNRYITYTDYSSGGGGQWLNILSKSNMTSTLPNGEYYYCSFAVQSPYSKEEMIVGSEETNEFAIYRQECLTGMKKEIFREKINNSSTFSIMSAVSSNNERIAYYDKIKSETSVFDIRSAKIIFRKKIGERPVFELSQDGNKLYHAQNDTIFIHNLLTAKKKSFKFNGNHFSKITEINSNYLLAGTHEGKLFQINLGNGTLTFIDSLSKSINQSLIFSKSINQILVLSNGILFTNQEGEWKITEQSNPLISNRKLFSNGESFRTKMHLNLPELKIENDSLLQKFSLKNFNRKVDLNFQVKNKKYFHSNNQKIAFSYYEEDPSEILIEDEELSSTKILSLPDLKNCESWYGILSIDISEDCKMFSIQYEYRRKNKEIMKIVCFELKDLRVTNTFIKTDYSVSESKVIFNKNNRLLINVLEIPDSSIIDVYSLDENKILNHFELSDYSNNCLADNCKFNDEKSIRVFNKIIPINSLETKLGFNYYDRPQSMKCFYYEHDIQDSSLYVYNYTDGFEFFNKRNKKIATLRIIDKENFIIIDTNYYYYSTNNRNIPLLFNDENKMFPFQQFDLKYNRPDIILKRLGYSDSITISTYHSAYLKRLKKMNFTEDMLKDDFHLPEIKIKNFEYLPSITDSTDLNLDLDIKDSKYKLDRINIFINDVPVFGTAGIDLRKENIQELNKKIKLFLSEGENKIQISVLNQAGAESYKETAYVTYKPKKSVQPNLYLVTIGDSKYSDSRYDLTYASKDATDIKNAFEKNANSLYENVYTYNYVDAQVTKENILKLKSELLKAKRDDVVIITVAGHGVLDDKLDYYLATHDMDFSNPSEKGLPYEELESLLDGIAPLKKVLFLDACHSGEVDKEEVELLATNTTTNSKVKFRNAGAGIQKKNLGLKTTSELMSELFTDLRRGTGATVISSAGGAEYAMESDEWKNGLFTYCLLHGLKDKAADENKDGQIMLSELQNYLRKEVTELSNGAQQPTSRIENLSMDFRVW